MSKLSRITPEKIFGKHLMLDMYGVAKNKLVKMENVFWLLKDLPDRIGMKSLITPYVVEARPENKLEWGISGFVMIYESHISVHTWPYKSYVSMDVYSCKDFDEKQLLVFLKKFWQPKRVEVQTILRG